MHQARVDSAGADHILAAIAPAVAPPERCGLGIRQPQRRGTGGGEGGTMFGYIGDLDRTLALMDSLRRQMDRTFDTYERAGRNVSTEGGGYPPINLYDTGSGFLIKAEVPGLTEKDINLTLNQDVVTLSGELGADAPEGYSVHRRERAPVRFSRSFSLPSQVDPKRVEASIKDGILTIQLERTEEQKPRQISVKAS
jgi:HSP20 family protein